MSKLDPEQAKKDLAQHYAGITDDELQELARDAGSLTDLAKETLRAEIARRKLVIELREEPPAEQQHPSLVAIRAFRDLPQALIAESILDSTQIECFLSDENVIRMDWFWSNALGGIKLLVKEEDAAAAQELLDQKPPPPS